MINVGLYLWSKLNFSKSRKVLLTRRVSFDKITIMLMEINLPWKRGQCSVCEIKSEKKNGNMKTISNVKRNKMPSSYFNVSRQDEKQMITIS